MPKAKPTPSNTTCVVGYCRVSTDGQADDGQSLDAQQAAISAYCIMRNLSLEDLIVDPGVSAGKPLAARSGGQRLLKLIQEHRVGGVVALKLDRLFRSAVDALTTVAAWDKAGIALHLLDLGGASVDTSSAIGRMFLTMTSGFAELERNLARERTAMALQRKVEKHERVGRVPYGYRICEDGVHVEPDVDEQRLLARLQAMQEEGLPLRRIVTVLNAEAVPAPSARCGGRQGVRWHLSTVHRLLSRRDAGLA
jgi:DNA invertase Pin-like site-specific DNA recombinase